MQRLIPVMGKNDIPRKYRNTPVGLLLEYHNLDRSFDQCANAKLLIGMCMDNRKHLRIPDNFAYIIRSGGANLRYSEFKVSYAIGVGGIEYIVLLGHNHCNMVNLANRKNQFIEGLVKRAGWHPEQAREHFYNFAEQFEIGNEIDFVKAEAKRLNLRYPKVTVVPMFYKLEDSRLYLIKGQY